MLVIISELSVHKNFRCTVSVEMLFTSNFVPHRLSCHPLQEDILLDRRCTTVAVNLVTHASRRHSVILYHGTVSQT